MGTAADPTTAATGTAYMFVKCASANLREKNDFWNPTYGGAAAGVMLGLPCTQGYLWESCTVGANVILEQSGPSRE